MIETEGKLSFVDSFFEGLQRQELSQAEASSRPHLLLLSQACEQMAGSESEQPGQELMLVWNAGITLTALQRHGGSFLAFVRSYVALVGSD